jgi:hypothetical protein
MDLMLLVYIINVVASFKSFIVVCSILFSVFFVALTITWVFNYVPSSYDRRFNLESHTEVKNLIGRWWKNIGIITVFIIIINSITPHEKTMYLMVGAYTAQKIAENDKTHVISEKVLKIIENKLDGYIDDVEKETNQKIEKITVPEKK